VAQQVSPSVMLLYSSASVPSITKRYVAIAKLRHPANFGPSSQEVYFIILILTPTKEVNILLQISENQYISTNLSLT